MVVYHFFSMMLFIFSKWIHVFPVIFKPWSQRTWISWISFTLLEYRHIWGNGRVMAYVFLPVSYRIKHFSSVSLFLPNLNSSVTNIFWDLYYLHRLLAWKNETPSFQFQYSSFSYLAQLSPFYHFQTKLF